MALDLLAKDNLASQSGVRSRYLRKHHSEVNIESSPELDLRPRPSTDASGATRALDLHGYRACGPNVPGLHRCLMHNSVKLISRKPRAGGPLSESLT
ncbi:hypothetical protein V8E51_004554 [Hyaloscypha variabilis]